MKTPPHRPSGDHRDAGRTPDSTRFPGARGLPANNFASVPAAPHRRYPSLADDGQPWFPRAPGWRRPAAAALFTANRSPVSWVRGIAFLLIIALIAALAVAS